MSVSQRSRVNSGVQIKKKKEEKNADLTRKKAGEVASVKAEEQTKTAVRYNAVTSKKKKEDNNKKKLAWST